MQKTDGSKLVASPIRHENDFMVMSARDARFLAVANPYEAVLFALLRERTSGGYFVERYEFDGSQRTLKTWRNRIQEMIDLDIAMQEKDSVRFESGQIEAFNKAMDAIAAAKKKSTGASR